MVWHCDRYSVVLPWWQIRRSIVLVIDTVWCYSNRQTKGNGRIPKIDLRLDTEEWLLLAVCTHSSEANVFSQQCWNTWIFICQKSKIGHYLALYAATDPQNIDLHVKWETSNFPPKAWITAVQAEWNIFPDSAAKLWFMKDENNKL